jgi:intracellular sulfur oxidation DsrE/DsrF family protein
MGNKNVSDELLNAFLDNELADTDRSKLFQAFEQDETLKTRACELHNLKELLQHAYPATPAPASRPVKHQHIWRRMYIQGVAASLMLLLFGGSSGWILSADATSKSYPRVTHLIQTIQNNNIAGEPDKIIVQVSNSNPVRLKAALDESENLLETYQATKRPLQLEVIANGGGLDLLRAGISPYESRLAKMRAKYQNLHFYACNLTINALQNKGVKVRLLPDTGIATSAFDEINNRVRQGWDYVRV